MVALRYRDEHNKVGYLQKPKGSDDYHQILDFLRSSHIRYALINDPIIFDSLVKQFWSTATLKSPELGPPAILATIDETPYTINEESVRSQLQLADDGGIDDLPIAKIYSGMDNLGYVTEGKLTFFKNKFSPQWRFLVHTIFHCLSTKSGSWDQFGSSIVVALICLSDKRRFNWSSYIFKGMVSNIGNAKKFLMYPRFLQTILGIETSITRQYHVFKLSSKLFANMKLNFAGQPMPLLAAMLSQAQEGEGAGAAAQAVPPPIPETIPETRPESDQPQDNVEDEPLGGSFHASPPRSTPASPTGHTSGGAEDHITLSALSSVVSTLVQKVNSLETELKAHKKLFKDVVAKLVKKVKALEVKLKTKKRKVVLSDSDQEEGGEQAVDLDALIALANAAVTVDSTKSPGGASSNPAACSYDPTSDVPTTAVPTDVPSGVDPTGPSTVSPGSTTVPTSSSIPADESIPARSGTTTATPSSPVKDARKGKGVAVEEPTPTQDKTFKQLEEERLGWEAAQRLQAQELADLEKQRAESLMKDANLARQMSQDFEMTEDQRKRQQEVLASAANYSDAAWDIILARLQANPDLSSTIFGVDFTDDDFAAKMVALVNSRRKELAEQRAQERRDRPMTPAQLRQYMRTYVKNQGKKEESKLSHIPTDGDFAPAHSTSPSRDPFKGKAARLEALERERYEKEKADIARQDAIYAQQLEQEEEMSASQRETRQAEVLSSAKHYSDADWIDIMAQVHANAGLSSELLGADVNDDNFAERMVALINQRKRAFAEQTAKEKRDRPMTPAQQREYMRVFVKNQSTTIYSTGWSMKYVKSLADEQLRAEFEKIRMAVADLKSNELRRTLKRAGEALEPDTSKKQKSTEAPIPSVPDIPQPQVVFSSKSSGTRRKSLGRSRMTKPELDLDADDKTFIKVVFDEDSKDEAPILWSAFAGWEVLLKLYGLVVKYYENHPGVGLMLWGDLQVLMDSREGGKGSSVWNHQSLWQIRSWRLYTLSNVYVLETISGEVLYMFADVSYPLSVKLMERMLKHKL
ncbi:hypothetical protein Tco_0092467 [Tanacetum coccineum]